MLEHSGHRQRLLKKIEDGIVYEHEYLEAILFNAQPRKNTNDLAHRLLAKFGTIENVFSASQDELMQVQGVGGSIAAYIYCTGKLCKMLSKVRKDDYPTFYEHRSFLGYLKDNYLVYSTEHVDFYFLDANSTIIRKASFESGNVGMANLSGETIGEMIARIGPSGMIMVHNHPQGNATPSDADDEATEKFRVFCAFHNVILCDHYICAKDGVYSYREGGRLHKLCATHTLPVDAKGDL